MSPDLSDARSWGGSQPPETVIRYEYVEASPSSIDFGSLTAAQIQQLVEQIDFTSLDPSQLQILASQILEALGAQVAITIDSCSDPSEGGGATDPENSVLWECATC